MTNGGTGPLSNRVLLVNSGRGSLPPTLALVDTQAPHKAEVILDNFFGRQFNSLNDAKIRVGGDEGREGAVYFTDVTCVSTLSPLQSLPIRPSFLPCFRTPLREDVLVLTRDKNRYGFLNHFRPLPQLPNQVYRLDLSTGAVRVVADGFDRPNGIAFRGDGRVVYV